jgi:hypothetical protein
MSVVRRPTLPTLGVAIPPHHVLPLRRELRSPSTASQCSTDTDASQDSTDNGISTDDNNEDDDDGGKGKKGKKKKDRGRPRHFHPDVLTYLINPERIDKHRENQELSTAKKRDQQGLLLDDLTHHAGVQFDFNIHRLHRLPQPDVADADQVNGQRKLALDLNDRNFPTMALKKAEEIRRTAFMAYSRKVCCLLSHDL